MPTFSSFVLHGLKKMSLLKKIAHMHGGVYVADTSRGGNTSNFLLHDNFDHFSDISPKIWNISGQEPKTKMNKVRSNPQCLCSKLSWHRIFNNIANQNFVVIGTWCSFDPFHPTIGCCSRCHANIYIPTRVFHDLLIISWNILPQPSLNQELSQFQNKVA